MRKKSIVGYMDSDWKLGWSMAEKPARPRYTIPFKHLKDAQRLNGDKFKKPVKIRLTVEEIK